ncbi:MAG TPA: hypothetical protein PLO37_15210 [Candidatus Hydrogenedentes bacterium]|nr:hypothetical protein [Candidatus Hydrogenedentota bacterium]HPG68196.1 hypothetical protein [Candidatus Hydrogenedentota bacterium]
MDIRIGHRLMTMAVAAVLLVACRVRADDSDLVPPERIGNWSRIGEIVTYTKDNLFDLIDGEAELYLPYGFSDVAVITYASDEASDERIDVEIYQMGSPLDAFGIYSRYREPDDDIRSIGVEGVVGSTAAAFCKGHFFVKLRFNVARKNKEGLLAVAEGIEQALAADAMRPPLLAVTDIPEKMAHSECYYATGVMDYAFFPRGISALANVFDAQLTAFVVFCGSPTHAEKARDAYEEHLAQCDAPQVEVPTAPEPTLVAEDPEHGLIALRVAGPFLVGIVGDAIGVFDHFRLLESVTSQLRKVSAADTSEP